MTGNRLIIIQFLLFITGAAFAQSPKEDIQSILDKTEIDSLLLFVRELSGDTSAVINGIVTTITSRHSGQPGNDKAQEYIAAKLNSYGLDVTIQTYSFSLISVNTLLIGQVPYSFATAGDGESKLTLARYLTRMPDLSIDPEMVQPDSYSQESSVGENVIGIQVGSTYPEKKYLVCAHYDCQPNYVIAPGADDNASGTAAVIEAARIFSQYTFPFTIVYALWDEEEQGLIGSRHYANTVRDVGDDILGVINLDMISWDSDNDSRIDIHTYPIANSEEIAALMTRMNAIFSLGLEIETVNPGTDRSDHASFWENEYGAILLVENWDDFNAYYHTPNDRVEHFNTAYYEKAAKLSYAALAWMVMDLRINISHYAQASIDHTGDIVLTAVVESILPVGGGSGGPCLYYRISTGSTFSEFERVSGSWVESSDTCSFVIPGQPLGTIVEYYLAAQDSDSTTVQTLPDGGKGFNPPGSIPPQEFFHSYIGTGDLVLFDDLSTFDNWSSTGTWNITSEKYSSPPSSLTDTPGGYYGIHEMNFVTLADTIDLRGFGSASLEFMTQWYIEEDMDYGEVQVSPNGVEWYSMPGLYSESGYGTFQPTGSAVYDGVQREWVHETIDLSDFFGERIVLRFLLKTNGYIIGDGWYIDDVMIRGDGPIDTEPQIFVRVDTLGFGQVFVDYTDSLELVIKNRGLLDLIITGVASDPTEYSVQPSTAIITPGGSKVFLIFFTPTTAADYPGTITFTSNDPDEGSLILPLAGRGVFPPIISISPASLIAELNTGETTTKTLTIFNTGASDLAGDLTFNVLADYLAGPGGHNYVLQFDGLDDYVDCGDLGFGSSVTDITVAMWIKPNSITADDGGWEFGGVPIEEFSLGIWVGLYHTKTNGQWFNYNAKDAGEWAHVVITYDGSMYKIYLDGALHGSNPYSESIDLLGRPFIIGTYDNREYYADGAIDEVSVWNVARTEAEIQENMNRQLTGSEPGLVGYWRFNEGEGDIAYDSSPNGNHGTLQGGVSWAVSSSPVVTWLSITPHSGAIQAGSSIEIMVTFDATTLVGGNYHTEIQIASNDPATPLAAIPVSLIATSLGTIEDQVLPQVFALHQNYPNPFNPVSTIRYDLPYASEVSLVVYDILGREVARLIDGYLEPGYHQVQWHGRNASGWSVPSGIYIARLATPEYSKSLKMLLLK